MKLFIFILALAAVAVADEKSIEDYLNDGNAQFTTRMFSEVVKQKPGESVVMSAFSVLTPLAQLSLASVGASHDELLKAIGLPNDNVTKSVFSLVNQKLRSVKGVELKTASKVYIPSGYQLNDNFAVISRDVFGSEVKNVNFNKNLETAQEINTWVESQTNNRIKDLVSPDSLGPDTRAVLVNAIYFKGSWKSKFEKFLTRDHDFHVSKDKTIKVPMMYKKDDFLYGESPELNAKLLSLPYEGDESSFLIVLPNEIDGLAALEEKLKDPSALPNALKNMYSTEIEVYIPKFKIETKTDLKEILMRMDVKRVFSPEAKLDNLLKDTSDLYVSEAIQKAFIEVNEDGAEAAAANEFGIRLLSAVVKFPQIVFDADHPYLFYLLKDNVILFNGAYIS